MKLILALAAVLVVAAVAVPVNDSFEAFKVKFGKKYLGEEEHMRRAVFEANLAKIEYQKIADPSAQYGITEFADMTEDEFRTQRLGFNAPSKLGFACTPPAPLKVADAPTSVDWRTKGAVTPVKNQGQCGSCWAFSTTGDIEGTVFRATGKLPVLSEQQLVDCDTVDQGCGGGLMDNAMKYVMGAGGVESEDEYAYKAIAGSCAFDKTKVVANISTYECPGSDEDQLAAYVAENGPVAIAINAAWMQTYMGGVADPPSILCNPKKLDHGVLIVGYGVDGKKPYWIIKNSWGPSWGEQGYYRIIRGKGKCGLNTFVVHSKA